MALSVATSLACGVASIRTPVIANPAYSANYGTATEVDNAAFTSSAFWAAVESEIPGFSDDPELERYRGFVQNLLGKANEEEVVKQFAVEHHL